MQLLLRFIGSIAVTTVFLTGCANFTKSSEAITTIAQTPITDKPSGKHFQGNFIWHDLLTSDSQSAGQFYEKLFGWQIEYKNQYAVIRNNNKLIGGIIQLPPSPEHDKDGIWIPTVSVTDVDAAANQVTDNGGKILKGPADMSLRGRAVLIADPQHANMVLLNAKGGDPVETEAETGDWLWDEIWSKDPETISAFYKQVLGYDDITMQDKYGIFKSKNKWQAGIRQLGDDSQHLLWVPVVRVADPTVIAKRVNELGGVVWIAPDEAPSKGDTALISDTSGAVLLIQRWPPLSDKEGH